MEHLINNYSPKNDKNKQLRSIKKKKNFKLLLLNKLFYIWMGHDGQGVGR